MTDPRDDWRKASFSGTQGDCVALHRTLTGVQDTKNPQAALWANGEQLVAAAKIVQFKR
jgi:hypothetical protein